MILRLPIIPFCIVIATVRSQAAAQGRTSLNALLGQATVINRNDNATLEQNIQDIFGTPDIPSTAANRNGQGITNIRMNDSHDQIEKPITPALRIKRRQIGCGVHHPDGVGFGKTVNTGNDAQFGEFPWMVAVLGENKVEGYLNILKVYECGGALIHPQAVLTAAHCVSNRSTTFKVRAGEWDTQHTQELYPHQDRDVESIVIHPQYYAGAVYNDVAVLYLREPLNIAENVDTICLPPQAMVPNSAVCYVTGWGKDASGEKGKYKVILQKISIPVVSNSECQERLRTTKLGKFFLLHKSFMCAGGNAGKDACKGDGGSPLVCPIPGRAGRYYHAGIVSWGIGCGENNIPGVYANVALFRDWIDTQMKAFGLDTSTYQFSV